MIHSSKEPQRTKFYINSLIAIETFVLKVFIVAIPKYVSFYTAVQYVQRDCIIKFENSNLLKINLIIFKCHIDA
jgi:hypothetical protein